MNLLPVIMSGGSGTRLWPVSRSKFPKQYANFLGETLHTMTLKRLDRYGAPLIITSENFRDLTELELRKNSKKAIRVLYETEPKNTAAAIAFCCRFLEMENRLDEVVGVFSSDNTIADEESFHKALKVATHTANQGYVVVLGIKPERPETGFGYIQVEDRAIGTGQATQVLKFHEKPSVEKAEEFLSAGDYFGNAGIFVFKVRHMIELMTKYIPDIWDHFSKLEKDFSNLDQVFHAVRSISIDYAVLEKLSKNDLRCVTCDIGWNDLGSWDSMLETREAIESGRDQRGSTHSSASGQTPAPMTQAIEVHARGNLVYGLDQKAYAVAAVDDLLIVDSKDALLICRRGQSQLVKEVVEKIKVVNPEKAKEHRFENRPWGNFEILHDEDYYKSKILRVDPGQRLSYQSHQKRSEHWIVVRGTATVLLNDQEKTLKVGEHLHIPLGAKHRLMNLSKEVMELIEVQTGSYFGEDDIERFQDDYGRKPLPRDQGKK